MNRLFWAIALLVVLTFGTCVFLVVLWQRAWGWIFRARDAARKRQLLQDLDELVFMFRNDPRPPRRPGVAQEPAGDAERRGMDA